MKLLLPTVRKIRHIYAFLVLKTIQNKTPYVTYEDVKDALAMTNVVPNKYQIKKYLLVLTSNDPPLIQPHAASLYTMYYKMLYYVVIDDSGNYQKALLGDVIQFKNDLILVLGDEDTENTITYAEMIKNKILKEAASND